MIALTLKQFTAMSIVGLAVGIVVGKVAVLQKSFGDIRANRTITVKIRLKITWRAVENG